MSRHMDWIDAASIGEAFFDRLKSATWPAPRAISERELSGQIGTGPSSDDRMRSLWVNDRLVATIQLFRDARNFSIVVCTEFRPNAAQPRESELAGETAEIEKATREIEKQHGEINRFVAQDDSGWDVEAHNDRAMLIKFVHRLLRLLRQRTEAGAVMVANR